MKKIERSEPKPKIQNLKLEICRISRIRVLSLRLSQVTCVSLIFLLLPNFACVNKSLLKKNKDITVAQENNMSAFERDLQTMKTANFDYIFAFRRKDMGVFDSEDKKYLRANTPPGTNRFVSTDEDRAFIAGSLYPFSPENLEALRNRFTVEDYSKPEAERRNINQNTNANR